MGKKDIVLRDTMESAGNEFDFMAVGEPPAAAWDIVSLSFHPGSCPHEPITCPTRAGFLSGALLLLNLTK